MQNRRRTMLLAAGLLAASWAPGAFAAKFANQFTEFELPPKWQCQLEGAEWVCQSTDQAKKRDAIIILAAKLKGDQDSLDQYLEYLKKPKVYTSVQKKPVKSEMKYAKTVSLSGHAWVDSLHLESEIPGFYTRYLATVKQDIGVLITYSINKDKYTEYLNDFENMVKTLKVFRKAGGINKGPTESLFSQTKLPDGLAPSTVFPGAAPTEEEAAPVKKKEKLPIAYILIGVAVIAFIIWKRRQSQG